MDKKFSRRNFLQKSTATAAGVAAFGSFGASNPASAQKTNDASRPREVWVASISQENIKEGTPEAMVRHLLQILEKTAYCKPDIVCLPEVFATSNLTRKYTLDEEVGFSEFVLDRFSEFSRKNNCYAVCPVYTSENGKVFNSAVILDRTGNKIGEYRKIYLPLDEMERGMTPGPLVPPVFETDFGRIGVQICFDIMWDDGWKHLGRQGAEIVFWPSAFAGGQMVNNKAWQHNYAIVSSTRNNTSKICDITGEVISKTGTWKINFVCAPINLEKAFLRIWPFSRRFGEIRRKYGRKVIITEFHEEGCAIIESLDGNVLVKDILREFDLKTQEQVLRESENAPNKVEGNVEIKDIKNELSSLFNK